MHCRNCGNEVSDQAIMCVACGVPPKNGSKFCHSCSATTDENAEICLKCGVALKSKSPKPIESSSEKAEGKDWIITLILCWLLGTFGIHRFYTGHIGIGVIQLLTFGGCGIWTLVDLVMIVTSKFKDSDGNLLVK